MATRIQKHPLVSTFTIATALDAKRRLIDALLGLERSDWETPLQDFVSRLADCGILIDDHTSSAILQDVAAELEMVLSVKHLLPCCKMRPSDHRLRTALLSVSDKIEVALLMDTLRKCLIPADPKTVAQMEKVTHYLAEHYEEPCTTARVAKLVGLSRGELSSQFQQWTQVTLHEYVTQLRIAKAERLIRDGIKIEAVSLMVGYKSKRSLYKQFKNRMGSTPRNYRARMLDVDSGVVAKSDEGSVA